MGDLPVKRHSDPLDDPADDDLPKPILVGGAGVVWRYVTAFSTVGERDGNPLPSTDSAGIQAFVDQYCATFPLESINHAALALIIERREKQ
jgi:hypothetical protein